MSATLEYKCPCCGGAVAFDSTLQKMKCPYCDAEFEPAALEQAAEASAARKPDALHWNTDGSSWQTGETAGMTVYSCRSCGGEIVGSADTAATTCPYCGNPVVMAGQFEGTRRPDLVLPFKLDRNAAKEGFRRHLQGKRLLPKFFSADTRLEEIKGLYVPFWLFDAGADAEIRYRATRVRRWSDASWDYTQTLTYAVTRAGSLEFEHVPVDGSSHVDDKLSESLEPYDIGAAVGFNTAYLAGYLADKYDVEAEKCVDRANERIKHSTEQAFMGTVQGYDTVEPEYSSVQLSNGTVRYALLPVWMLTARWNDKPWTFAMNGQTGAFVGDLPLDRAAYWKLLGITAAVASAVYCGLAWLVHLL